ncbi:3-deoxy-manno-octulosonate cytidylyltransferase [Blochmannia endosymbiont of Colobopsis nipponica]|uniref:3-deoxy-manno-octulosonate cytidylyltransferase n=1 Tax=Blochmannia endosymbiont of Colobopsis nipponica TaxID=2681987 RepID=UPI001786324F|nr:3-deoxy-manno-octulosonate cytidylyltransferase [Blochmannia endosymbiont of Colobopsis nipponica]QOI11072.1 3-deoxy-manno-octulosonate cytidylyltransferase [Blochmannia endosymbiont of Colobopsis nipponica]
MNFVVVIPARLASRRLPNKLLMDIHGKPMISYTVESALASGADQVIVATDHLSIVKAIKYLQLNSETYLTKGSYRSGTERIKEVIDYYGFDDDQIIINVQGDEPLMPSKVIHQLANSLHDNKIKIATAAVPMTSMMEARNVNVVKVVLDINNYALYFSRAIIPYDFKCNIVNNVCNTNIKLLRHMGIYSYRVHSIHSYVQWNASPLEEIESLEQLRVLWYGGKIYTVIFNDVFNISVNSIDDLNKVRLFIKEKIDN